MPTYQYSCTECGHSFETFQSFSDNSLTECPDCGGRLRKVFNAVGVVFKGSGFYRNDSRAAPDKGPETSPDKSPETSPDKSRENGDRGPDKKTDKSGEKAPERAATSPGKPPDKSSNGTKAASEKKSTSSSS